MNDFFSDRAAKTKKEHLSHCKQEIIDLADRKERISWDEWMSLAMNSYERRLLYPRLSTLALARLVRDNIIPNCTTCHKPITYDEVLKDILVPLLLERIADLTQAIQDIDQTLRIPAAEYVPAISDVFQIIDGLCNETQASTKGPRP